MKTKQEKTRHTATPWKRGPLGGIYQVHTLEAVGGCYDPNGVPHDNWNADEKFIVKACSNHYALVEALKIALPYVKHTHSNLTCLTKNPIEEDLNKINAALKAVEGE